MPYLLIFIIIFIHELGHFITAKLLKFEIDKIYLYPFGGISKIAISLNESIIKELLVLIMGPLIQILGTLILIKLNIFNRYNIYLYNTSKELLMFNLLPIYPLDGGRIINIILNSKLNIKQSFKLVIKISIITIICFLIYNLRIKLNIGIILIVILLIIKLLNEKNIYNEMYNNFLLERYLNKYNFKGIKYINNINEFYRNKRHIIKYKNNYLSEKEILSEKFNLIY